MTVADAAGVPIPGATGSGVVRVGTPVTATLTSSPDVLPAGNTKVVSNTLTLTAQVPLAAPLTLVGQETTPTSISVVVHHNCW